MNRYFYALVSLICIVAVNCGDTGRIKTKPAGENPWEICPNCHGYGTIISFDRKDAPGNDNISNQTIISQESNLDTVNTSKSRNLTEESLPARSHVAKKVKCPVCYGKGWITVELPITKPFVIKDVKITEKDGKIEYREK